MPECMKINGDNQSSSEYSSICLWKMDTGQADICNYKSHNWRKSINFDIRALHTTPLRLGLITYLSRALCLLSGENNRLATLVLYPDKGSSSPLTKTKNSLSRLSSREARTTPAGVASVPFLKEDRDFFFLSSPVCALDPGPSVPRVANTSADSICQFFAGRIVIALDNLCFIICCSFVLILWLFCSTCLWNVLAITFHGVKFLLKPRCKYVSSSFIERKWEIPVTQRFLFVWYPRTFGFCPHQAQEELWQQRMWKLIIYCRSQTIKAKTSLFEVKVARISCLGDGHCVPLDSRAALLLREKCRCTTQSHYCNIQYPNLWNSEDLTKWG